jgi:hypothetical protein
MLTINGDPMNIGFYAAEDQMSGGYYHYYFLDSIDVNEGDDVKFIAKARIGNTLYSSSVVVPAKINISEPPPDATIHPGDEIYVMWEGGDPCTFFQVFYFEGEFGELHEAEVAPGSKNAVIATSATDHGNIFIIVVGARNV